LQGQAVGHTETEHVLRESRRGSYAIAGKPFQLPELVDFQLQLFAQEFFAGPAAETRCQATIDSIWASRCVLVKYPKALHFPDELVQHGADRGENLLQIGRLGGIALQCSALAKVSFISLVKARVK